MDNLEFTFFGVRGSYPVSNNDVKKYGGNTTSMLIKKGESLAVIDAGTGIINIGEYLKKNRPEIKEISIFLTHFHLDHLMGLPFFYPFSEKGFSVKIYYPGFDGIDIESILFGLFNPPYSPIGYDGILADVDLIELDIRKTKPIVFDPDFIVKYHYDASHPKSGVLLYRIESEGKSLVFATDIEAENGFSDATTDFVSGSDVLIHDSQYLDEDYHDINSPKKGYGHSTVTMAVEDAIKCNVNKLFLFHFNPLYSDKMLERILKEVKKRFKNSFLSTELKNNIL